MSSRSRSRSPSLAVLADRHSDAVAAVQEVEDDDRHRRSRSPCASGNPRLPLTMRMRDGERNDQNEDADFADDVAVIADDEEDDIADDIDIANIADDEEDIAVDIAEGPPAGAWRRTSWAWLEREDYQRWDPRGLARSEIMGSNLVVGAALELRQRVIAEFWQAPDLPRSPDADAEYESWLARGDLQRGDPRGFAYDEITGPNHLAGAAFDRRNRDIQEFWQDPRHRGVLNRQYPADHREEPEDHPEDHRED
jgi:hypothetical protein